MMTIKSHCHLSLKSYTHKSKRNPRAGPSLSRSTRKPSRITTRLSRSPWIWKLFSKILKVSYLLGNQNQLMTIQTVTNIIFLLQTTFTIVVPSFLPTLSLLRPIASSTMEPKHSTHSMARRYWSTHEH